MNCPKILSLIKESEVLHKQSLAQIQQFSETFFDMRPKKDLNIFTELRKINTEYERLKKQIGDNLKQIENLLNPQINIHYTYTNPETNTEYQEDIHIDIEQQITEHIDFYQQTNIDLPPNFRETALDIWNRNYAEIQSQIEQFGFNGVLIVPGNIPLGELSEKMKIKEGYYDRIKSISIVSDLRNIPLQSTGTDKPRIILYHKTQNLADRPELKQTLGVKAQDINLEESFTLDDYIIISRKYFEETGNHLDKKGWTWTPRSKSGTRFVHCSWSPGNSALGVDADDALPSSSILGCRPSRYFF
jgi:hypothetical protein